MFHYFTKTYPRRLKELKGELDKIGEEFSLACKNNDNKACGYAGAKFTNELKRFSENTKLHVVGLKESIVGREKGIIMCHPKYIYEYIGKDSVAGTLIFILYEEAINNWKGGK